MLKVGNRRGGWVRSSLDLTRHVAVQVAVSVIVATVLKGASLAGLGHTVFAGIPWLGDAREEPASASVPAPAGMQASLPALGHALPILAVLDTPPVIGIEAAMGQAAGTAPLPLPELDAAEAAIAPHRPRPLAPPRIVVERPCGACQPAEMATPVAPPEEAEPPPLPPGYVGVDSAAAPQDRFEALAGTIQATLASAGSAAVQTLGHGQRGLQSLAGHWH